MDLPKGFRKVAESDLRPFINSVAKAYVDPDLGEVIVVLDWDEEDVGKTESILGPFTKAQMESITHVLRDVIQMNKEGRIYFLE